MTRKLTIEQAKRLRNDFECWQQDYDPKGEKEQYDMFGRGIIAMDMLIAVMYQNPTIWTNEEELRNVNVGEVVVTRNEQGDIVAVTRQDEEGHILDIISLPLDEENNNGK